MKQLLIFGAFVLSLGLQAGAVPTLPPSTATPGYCGPAADTAAVQNLWLNTQVTGRAGQTPQPLNASYIMSIIVSGNYSQVMWQSAGQANSYYLKQGSTWHLVGNFPPKAWPKSVITKFNGVVNGWGQGGKPCVNPRFVNHPSGP